VRVLLLTTDTPHHLYYAWRMREAGMLSGVVLECARREFAFPTAHPFETERDQYERTVLLANGPSAFEQLGPVVQCETVNTGEALQAMRGLRPDVCIVFGTGRLLDDASRLPGVACLNLHGGNPEAYRGLDSHLWTIYHRDFDNLVTTLHHVAPGLDTGDIVLASRLPLPRGTTLPQLRSINTSVCVDLSQIAVGLLAEGRTLPSRPQLARGRYYSAMPASLKEICLKHFARYTATL
jgi:methionyl-tRNA formyltransferase